jgi:hypothetical protein
MTTNGKTAAVLDLPDIASARVTISPPNFQTAVLKIVGTSPYMQAKFSEKSRQAMASKMLAGSTAGKGTKRQPRDFDADFRGAQHRSTDGWVGVPASAFRNACIDACRVVGFQMTRARMSLFVDADGFDVDDGTPLVRLDADDPERTEMAVRNETGVVDIRVRPMWRKWAATLRLTFDADQFTTTDVVNLLSRAGVQVGVGEGRPFSRKSAGMGFGLFRVESHDAE